MGEPTHFDRVMSELQNINTRLGKIDSKMSAPDYQMLVVLCLGFAPVMAVLIGLLIGTWGHPTNAMVLP